MKRDPRLQKPGVESDRNGGGRTDYEAPKILVMSEEELLESIGPAQAYSGLVPGSGGGL